MDREEWISSRLAAEERRFGRTLVSVSTHTGRVSLSGAPMGNFDIAVATEWACYVLNGWDFKADPDEVRSAINRFNREKRKK